MVRVRSSGGQLPIKIEENRDKAEGGEVYFASFYDNNYEQWLHYLLRRADCYLSILLYFGDHSVQGDHRSAVNNHAVHGDEKYRFREVET